MLNHCHNRMTALVGFVFLWSPVTNTAVAAEVLDPTKLSSEIESRLAAERPVANPQPTTAHRTDNRMEQIQPRLHGMVLRDRDHGTAFISVGDSPAQWVPLRRGAANSPINRVMLGGISFIVAEFNETEVVLQSVNGSHQCVAR